MSDKPKFSHLRAQICIKNRKQYEKSILNYVCCCHRIYSKYSYFVKDLSKYKMVDHRRWLNYYADLSENNIQKSQKNHQVA
jgi:hypothetical protein